MKIFATILRDYVSANSQFTNFKRLAKDCIDSTKTIPRNNQEFIITKAKWDILRSEFSGVHIPSQTFYPILLQNYMNDKIKREEFEEKSKLWVERLQTEEMLFKRHVDLCKSDMEKAYNEYRQVHKIVPEFEEVFECIEKHPNVFWALLSAEFEIKG